MQGVLWRSVCFYCPGFLQFSAILVPGIAAQSRLDTKEKDILQVILRLEINQNVLSNTSGNRKMYHCKTRVDTTCTCVQPELFKQYKLFKQSPTTLSQLFFYSMTGSSGMR